MIQMLNGAECIRKNCISIFRAENDSNKRKEKAGIFPAFPFENISRTIELLNGAFKKRLYSYNST